jgi:hypothetical protein
MYTATHDLPTLFAQLGLDNSDEAIEDFIHTYAGTLKDSAHLHQAPFWNAGQARFLADAIREDADWAEAVDSLSALLRHY